ncbi:HEPN domain-containing protein [Candidatus Symbiopectobacterium sp. NZEC127]|uniref:HEPN domain-containing protein n=1 Tax=Candidatus Symbiopectobacterium sp. NZEC127 TaxID=2820472 RepID=UPI002227ACA1|nr:HEPN domain-containing protein [Candidatus Symbiopectobacterium sp. NZEC127]
MFSPKLVFDNAWLRCDVLATTYAFSSRHMTRVFESEELLRAEWVARISALDLYVHELISQQMLEVFKNQRAITPAYEKFSLPFRVIESIKNSANDTEANSFFDLEVRRQLGFLTFQNSKSIADGIRLISQKELWKEIAMHQGVSRSLVEAKAKSLKLQLDILVDRRNKIAHEGDMQPVTPRTPWPINSGDLIEVKKFIGALVSSIDNVIP